MDNGRGSSNKVKYCYFPIAITSVAELISASITLPVDSKTNKVPAIGLDPRLPLPLPKYPFF